MPRRGGRIVAGDAFEPRELVTAAPRTARADARSDRRARRHARAFRESPRAGAADGCAPAPRTRGGDRRDRPRATVERVAAGRRRRDRRGSRRTRAGTRRAIGRTRCAASSSGVARPASCHAATRRRRRRADRRASASRRSPASTSASVVSVCRRRARRAHAAVDHQRLQPAAEDPRRSRSSVRNGVVAMTHSHSSRMRSVTPYARSLSRAA